MSERSRLTPVSILTAWIGTSGSQLEHFSPRLVVIEFNPTIPNDVFFVQARDQSFNHGSSLLALIELARQKGYELVVTTDVNAFFVRSDLFHLFGIEDNSIGAIHNPGAYESRIFQLYDGTLVLGRKKKSFLSLNSDRGLDASAPR